MKYYRAHVRPPAPPNVYDVLFLTVFFFISLSHQPRVLEASSSCFYHATRFQFFIFFLLYFVLMEFFVWNSWEYLFRKIRRVLLQIFTALKSFFHRWSSNVWTLHLFWKMISISSHTSCIRFRGFLRKLQSCFWIGTSCTYLHIHFISIIL